MNLFPLNEEKKEKEEELCEEDYGLPSTYNTPQPNPATYTAPSSSYAEPAPLIEDQYTAPAPEGEVEGVYAAPQEEYAPPYSAPSPVFPPSPGLVCRNEYETVYESHCQVEPGCKNTTETVCTLEYNTVCTEKEECKEEVQQVCSSAPALQCRTEHEEVCTHADCVR